MQLSFVDWSCFEQTKTECLVPRAFLSLPGFYVYIYPLLNQIEHLGLESFVR
jgi:hypothetical protein